MEKGLLVTGEIYHVFTKSIAGFRIFNDSAEFLRMIETIRYYQRKAQSIRLSRFNYLKDQDKLEIDEGEKLIEIIAYCLMPTHLHLVLKQLIDKGVSTGMNNILNSYSRYFNIRHNRKGPLWEGRFKRVLVKSDEQLLHLTRYVHLNPVTAYLVDKPTDWTASSYKEFIGKNNIEKRICEYKDILNIESDSYKDFVEDRISYQRELAKIKDLILE